MTSISRTLSTLTSNLTGRNNVARVQAELEKAGVEISTGFKADVFEDLGMQASQTMVFRNQLDRTDAFVTSNTLLATKMQFMSDTMSSVSAVAQEVLEQAVINLDAPGQTADTLQQKAQTAIDSIVGMLNSRYGGVTLFSGVNSSASPLQGYSDINADTGQSPQDVVEGMAGGTLTDVTDAAAKIDAFDQVFSSENTSTPGDNFESTFYNGTPLVDAAGDPMARLTATIDDEIQMTYGVQANDPAITDLLKGLMMVASMDISQIEDQDAYSAWMSSATTAMDDGITGLNLAQARLGGQQSSLDQLVSRQQDLTDIYTSQIIASEGVDSYDAATRFTALEAQLEATYTVTARLSQLSFLSYM